MMTNVNDEENVDELKFFHYQWHKITLISYINIIDYDGKMEAFESEPWSEIPITEKNVLQYCQSNIYNCYIKYLLSKIVVSNHTTILEFLQKMLQVGKIYHITSKDTLTDFFINVICCLFKKQCYDVFFFLDFWNALSANSKHVKKFVLSDLFKKHCEHNLYVPLSYTLKIAQAAYYNINSCWFNEDDLSRLSFCPVTLTLLKGDVDQLGLFLCYGYKQNSQRILTYDKFFRFNDIYPWLKMPLEKEKLGRRAIVTEVLLFLLKFGISASPHMRQSVVKCFNLLWSVNPDPLVTIPEIESEIQFRFQHPPEYRTRFRCFPDTQEHFMKLTGMIQIECSKTIALVFEPRTLQHLCKCNIRTLLLKAGNLPRGIKYLGLPNLLESYMNVYI